MLPHLTDFQYAFAIGSIVAAVAGSVFSIVGGVLATIKWTKSKLIVMMSEPVVKLELKFRSDLSTLEANITEKRHNAIEILSQDFDFLRDEQLEQRKEIQDVRRELGAHLYGSTAHEIHKMD